MWVFYYHNDLFKKNQSYFVYYIYLQTTIKEVNSWASKNIVDGSAVAYFYCQEKPLQNAENSICLHENTFNSLKKARYIWSFLLLFLWGIHLAYWIQCIIINWQCKKQSWLSDLQILRKWPWVWLHLTTISRSGLKTKEFCYLILRIFFSKNWFFSLKDFKYSQKLKSGTHRLRNSFKNSTLKKTILFGKEGECLNFNPIFTYPLIDFQKRGITAINGAAVFSNPCFWKTISRLMRSWRLVQVLQNPCDFYLFAVNFLFFQLLSSSIWFSLSN